MTLALTLTSNAKDTSEGTRLQNRIKAPKPVLHNEEDKRARRNKRLRDRYARDPVFREKRKASSRVNGLNRYHNTPGVKEAKLAQQRERYARDPEFRAANLAASTSWQKTHSEQYALQKKAAAANVAAKKQDIAGRLRVSDIRRLVESNPMQCAYCGGSLSSLPGKHEIWSLDHKVPLSRGGANEYSNLAIADSKCNTSKSDRTPAEFKAYKANHTGDT